MSAPKPPDDELSATDFDDPFKTVTQDSRVLGEYKLIGELGRGGMGVVYEAQRVGSSTSVALKTLSRFEPSALHRFKQEFRILADLAHPNLVQLGELVTTQREPFFTMEFIRGVNFLDYVRHNSEASQLMQNEDTVHFGFDEARLRGSLSQVVDGLRALHRAGSLHRDLKPSNVIVNSDGRVAILDFGLAVETHEGKFRNAIGEIVGTPLFMAPEQATRETVTPAADWYSLGVMLFQSLTNALPFESGSFEKLQIQKLNGPKRTPQSLVPNIPTDLNSLCIDLLNPDPRLRPAGDEIASRLSPTTLSIRTATVWIGREEQLAELNTAWQQTRTDAGKVVFVAGKSGMGKSALVNRFLKQIAESTNAVVLRGRCYQNETVAYRGFDSLVDSLVQYLHQLPQEKVERILPIDLDAVCQLFPVLSDVRAVESSRSRHRAFSDPQEVRRRGILALHEMLVRLAHWEPVVLFLDDLQWGDEDTAMIFRQLTQADKLPRALIICTYRAEERETSCCLNLIRRVALQSSDQVQLAEQLEINVDRFSNIEATQLATELLQHNRQFSPAIVQRIVSETDGDPLFIRAFANYVTTQSDSTPSDAKSRETIESERGEFQWTKSLSDVLWSEVIALPRDQRQTVELLAAAGRPVPWRAVKELVDFDQDPMTTLKTLRIKRIIRQSSEHGDIETYHDKIRETVELKLRSEQTRYHCSRLAGFLESQSSPGDAEFLGDLFRKSDQSEKAGQHYFKAGKHAAEILAFHRAASLFGQALDHLKPTGLLECELRVHYGNALAYASRGADSATQYLRAAELADEAARPDWLQQAALRFLISGHVDAGVQTLIKALQSVQLTWPKSTAQAIAGLLTREAWLRIRGLRVKPLRPVLHQVNSTKTSNLSSDDLFTIHEEQLTPYQQRRARICWSAAAGLSVVDPVRGSYFMTENLKIALGLRVPKYLLRALAAYVGHVAIGGSFSRKTVRKVLLEARRIATNEDHPYFAGTLLTARGIAALLRGQWPQALRCCDRALEYLHDARCRDVTWEINTARTFALWSLQYQGNLTELASRQPELLRMAKETNDLFASLNFGTQVMTHLQLAIGQPTEARSRLQEDQARLSDQGFFVQHHNHLLANVFVDIYEGKGDEAMKRLEGQWRNYQRSFLSRVQQIRIDYYQHHCRAALAAAQGNDQKSASLQTAKQFVRKLKLERVAYANAFAKAFQASVDFMEGKPQESRLNLEQASILFGKTKMQLFRLACLEHLGHHFSDCQPTDNASSNMDWGKLGVLKDPELLANSLIPGFKA